MRTGKGTEASGYARSAIASLLLFFEGVLWFYMPEIIDGLNIIRLRAPGFLPLIPGAVVLLLLAAYRLDPYLLSLLIVPKKDPSSAQIKKKTITELMILATGTTAVGVELILPVQSSRLIVAVLLIYALSVLTGCFLLFGRSSVVKVNTLDFLRILLRVCLIGLLWSAFVIRFAFN